MEEMREEQFMTAYNQHADAIFRFCLFRVVNRELAQDLTQETFMRVWRHISKGNDVYFYKALLYRVARNVVIDHSRKKTEESLEQLEENGFNPANPRDVDDVHQHIDSHHVLHFLEQLGEIDREIITLRYIEGFKVKEIAQLLGRSPTNVSVRLYRGLRQIRQLAEYEKAT